MPYKKPRKGVVQLNLRTTPRFARRLSAAAKNAGRSLNAEINALAAVGLERSDSSPLSLSERLRAIADQIDALKP